MLEDGFECIGFDFIPVERYMNADAALWVGGVIPLPDSVGEVIKVDANFFVHDDEASSTDNENESFQLAFDAGPTVVFTDRQSTELGCVFEPFYVCEYSDHTFTNALLSFGDVVVAELNISRSVNWNLWNIEGDYIAELGTITMLVDNTEGNTSPVPVPAAAWLLGSGLIGLVGVARRRT